MRPVLLPFKSVFADLSVDTKMCCNGEYSTRSAAETVDDRIKFVYKLHWKWRSLALGWVVSQIGMSFFSTSALRRPLLWTRPLRLCFIDRFLLILEIWRRTHRLSLNILINPPHPQIYNNNWVRCFSSLLIYSLISGRSNDNCGFGEGGGHSSGSQNRSDGGFKSGGYGGGILDLWIDHLWISRRPRWTTPLLRQNLI